MIPIVSSSFGPTGVNGQIAPVRRIFANATVSVLATSTTARACSRDHRLNGIKLSDFFYNYKFKRCQPLQIWSDWSNWSECFSSGYRVKSRDCLAGSPHCKGKLFRPEVSIGRLKNLKLYVQGMLLDLG